METHNMQNVLRMQQAIIEEYKVDMLKYAPQADKSRIRECFESIPRQLSKENKKFGYTRFGNFFFLGDDFYVWEKDDKYAEDHNQDVVEAVFGVECEGRGYARRVIFAGVQTGFKDCNGERIFTGDVTQIVENEYSTHVYAVGAFANEDGSGDYCFILDNHYWALADCNRRHFKLTRIGTVFYQLDASDYIGVNQRTIGFNGWRDTEEDKHRKTLMAKYTPNFDKEFWKYKGLEILGVEFDWK